MKLTIPDFKELIKANLKISLNQLGKEIDVNAQNISEFLNTEKLFLPMIPKISEFVLGKKATVQINEIYYLENEACDFTLFSLRLKSFCEEKYKENKKFSVRNVCIELDIPISAKISLIRQRIYVQIKTEHLQKFFAFFDKKYDYKEEIFVFID